MTGERAYRVSDRSVLGECADPVDTTEANPMTGRVEQFRFSREMTPDMVTDTDPHVLQGLLVGILESARLELEDRDLRPVGEMRVTMSVTGRAEPVS